MHSEQGTSGFDRLVLELSREERHDMLVRLTKMLEGESEPVHVMDDEPHPVNLESEYSGFSFFQKIIVFFRILFTPLTRIEVIEDAIMRQIYHELDSVYPGLYDYSSGTLSSVFLEEIKNLRKSVQIFMLPLSRLTIQKKEELFAFIVNQDLPHIDQRIRDACVPEKFVSELDEGGEKELARYLYNQFEDILFELTPEEKGKLAQDSRFLQILSELVYFPYDKIKNKYAGSSHEGRCPASEIRDPLTQLMSIFHSMNCSASPALIESLFILTRLEQEDTDPRVLLDELKRDIARTSEGLRGIRNFYRSVPLYDILRLASGKANIFFKPVSAGEEWLTLLRSFWKQKLKKEARRFLLSREYDMTIEQAKLLLEGKDLKPLSHYQTGGHPVSINLVHEWSMAFLSGFLDFLFSLKINMILKQLLIDGEFYKEQNSEDYSEAYNGLHLLAENIGEPGDFLSPSGEGGKLLFSIASDVSAKNLRQKKAAKIADEADMRARRLLHNGLELITLLSSVLEGILHGEKGGRFDTLSNLGYIGGRNNEAFLKELGDVSQAVTEGRRILESMIALEEQYARTA
ncbi:DUF5312 family protein [Marispirochaeta sp.]|uniref:DUF5312 family protein n=1 Tax=Marispirochaeta sp. TaxID=2038653 RepID=UPI0029C69B26|nr:DUF5312 family protein [Marispirochaeta sp.]